VFSIVKNPGLQKKVASPTVFFFSQEVELTFISFRRVWKGILGIRDLTKIRCGIWENAKYLDGIRDLTATREAGFAKIWARDAGFCCPSVGNSGSRHDPNKRYSGKSESTRRAQNINRKGQSTSQIY